MVVREMIATARERIAKLREAKKMVGARGGAERQREQGASRTHLKEAAGTVARTLNLLLNGKKESRLEICVSGSVIWSAGQECGGSEIGKARSEPARGRVCCVSVVSQNLVS